MMKKTLLLTIALLCGSLSSLMAQTLKLEFLHDPEEDNNPTFRMDYTSREIAKVDGAILISGHAEKEYLAVRPVVNIQGDFLSVGVGNVFRESKISVIDCAHLQTLTVHGEGVKLLDISATPQLKQLVLRTKYTPTLQLSTQSALEVFVCNYDHRTRYNDSYNEMAAELEDLADLRHCAHLKAVLVTADRGELQTDAFKDKWISLLPNRNGKTTGQLVLPTYDGNDVLLTTPLTEEQKARLEAKNWKLVKSLFLTDEPTPTALTATRTASAAAAEHYDLAGRQQRVAQGVGIERTAAGAAQKVLRSAAQ